MNRRRILQMLLTGFSLTSAGLAASQTSGQQNQPVRPNQSGPWSRELRSGSQGADVAELQVRIGGWAADSPDGSWVAIDGNFGPGTEAALNRFQQAYGLPTTGVADNSVFEVLNSWESADRSTRNFEWAEFTTKGHHPGTFEEGKVTPEQVQENVRRVMYRLEALRKKLGDTPLQINSGFRCQTHNQSVGGARNSQHQYGTAADVTGASPAEILQQAKTCGFSFGYTKGGYAHLDIRNG